MLFDLFFLLPSLGACSAGVDAHLEVGGLFELVSQERLELSILLLLHLDRSPLVRDERLSPVHAHLDLTESSELHLLLPLADRSFLAVAEAGDSKQLCVNCLLPGHPGSVRLTGDLIVFNFGEQFVLLC